MTSYSVSDTVTFTVTHARHLASKVATDLVRMSRLYGAPDMSTIDLYEAEMVMLLQARYLQEVTYGFKRGANWIEPTLRYTALELAASSADDDPGRIRAGADISGAAFHSYLIRGPAWNELSATARDAFDAGLPFRRTGAAEPGLSGYLQSDRNYSAGGRSLQRLTLRSTL